MWYSTLGQSVRRDTTYFNFWVSAFCSSESEIVSPVCTVLSYSKRFGSSFKRSGGASPQKKIRSSLADRFVLRWSSRKAQVRTCDVCDENSCCLPDRISLTSRADSNRAIYYLLCFLLIDNSCHPSHSPPGNCKSSQRLFREDNFRNAGYCHWCYYYSYCF